MAVADELALQTLGRAGEPASGGAPRPGDHRPLRMTAPVALSCGDPAGIGPEIAVAAWRALGDELPFVWIGDPRHLPPGTPVARSWPIPAAAAEAAAAPAFPVLPLPFAAPAVPGQPDPANAARRPSPPSNAAWRWCRRARRSALCTAPINKKALTDGAGFAFPGHTEFLAHLAGVDRRR